MTTALQLEGLVTKKPRVSKYTMKPQAVNPTSARSLIMQANESFSHSQPTSPPSSLSTYRINATNGNTCILIQTDALLSIQYRDKLNEDREADIYLPDYPGLTGLCNDPSPQQLTNKTLL